MTGPSNVQDETDKAFADNISVDASLALDYPDDDTDLASDEHLESDHIFESDPEDLSPDSTQLAIAHHSSSLSSPTCTTANLNEDQTEGTSTISVLVSNQSILSAAAINYPILSYTSDNSTQAIQIVDHIVVPPKHHSLPPLFPHSVHVDTEDIFHDPIMPTDNRSQPPYVLSAPHRLNRVGSPGSISRIRSVSIDPHAAAATSPSSAHNIDPTVEVVQPFSYPNYPLSPSPLPSPPQTARRSTRTPKPKDMALRMKYWEPTPTQLPPWKRSRINAHPSALQRRRTAPQLRSREGNDFTRPRAQQNPNAQMIRTGAYGRAGAVRVGEIIYIEETALIMHDPCERCAAAPGARCSGLVGERCGRCRNMKQRCSNHIKGAGKPGMLRVVNRERVGKVERFSSEDEKVLIDEDDDEGLSSDQGEGIYTEDHVQQRIVLRISKRNRGEVFISASNAKIGNAGSSKRKRQTTRERSRKRKKKSPEDGSSNISDNSHVEPIRPLHKDTNPAPIPAASTKGTSAQLPSTDPQNPESEEPAPGDRTKEATAAKASTLVKGKSKPAEKDLARGSEQIVQNAEQRLPSQSETMPEAELLDSDPPMAGQDVDSQIFSEQGETRKEDGQDQEVTRDGQRRKKRKARATRRSTRIDGAGSVQTSDSQVSNLEGDRDEQIARLRDSVTEMQAELGKLRNMRETIDRLYSLAENVSRGLELLESQPQASR